MTPLVTADRLTRHFWAGSLLGRHRPVQAVTDVSLTVNHGEAVGLVGESGSGKSTIGRLLLGLTAPTAGRVLLDGIDLARVKRSRLKRLRRRMQLVFQDPYSSLDPRRHVEDQIADGLTIHRLCPPPDRTARVASLLEQVGLEPAHGNRYPHEFSGGQRQRIGIARALSTSPEFLVADEPVSALDVSVQAQVLRVLANLRSRLELGLLFISHDLPVVRSLCDRVIVLYLGRIMEEGPAAEVLAHPRHPYTRALLSAAPTLDHTQRRKRILLRGEPPSPTDPPSGCVFRTRCPWAIDPCATTVPPLRGSAAHRAACIRDDIQS
jgi:peptide/nickel transport system ATP-binding protein